MIPAAGYFFSGRLVQTAGLTLLHLLWQAAVIAVLLALTLWACRGASPRIRYAASYVALLLIPVFAAATFVGFWLAPERSWVDQARFVRTSIEVPLLQSAAPPAPFAESGPSPTAFSPTDLAHVNWSWSERLLPTIVALWAAVATVGAIAFVATRIAVAQRYCGGAELPESWRRRLTKLAARLRMEDKIRLIESPSTQTPLTFGWLRPVVVLPRTAVQQMPRSRLAALIVHELAHVKRRDYLHNIIQKIVLLLLFFHPVVWWIHSLIVAEREYCCDELACQVVRNRRRYSESLYEMEKLRNPLCALGIGAGGGQLLGRIERVTDAEWTPQFNFSHCFYLGLFAAVVAYFAAPLSASLESVRDLRAQQSAAELRLWPPEPPLFEKLPHPSANPREVVLPENGRLAFTDFVTPQYHRQNYLLRLPRPAQIQVQVIPLTPGFRPHLQSIWVDEADETIVDGDMESGRGGRPSLILASLPQAPDVSVGLNVFGRDMHNSDLPWPFGRYIFYVRTLDHPHDHDDDLLGFAAAPIVLDNRGRALLETGQPPLPLALECPGDVDAFQFQAVSNRPLRITVEPLQGGFLSDLRIFGDDGRLVAAGNTESSTGRSSARIIANVGRRYYLVVAAQDVQATGDYALAITPADGRQERGGE